MAKASSVSTVEKEHPIMFTFQQSRGPPNKPI